MAGLKYVGAEYTSDSNAGDVVGKADVDGEFSAVAVNQTAVQGQVSAAVATYASRTWVNTQLFSFAPSTYFSLGNNYTLAIQGSATTSGTYTLTYGGQTTPPIAFNATAAEIQASFSAFTNLTAVVVSGPGPYVLNINPIQVSTLTADSTGLTSGTAVVAPGTLIPNSWVGEYIAPLNSSGVIPTQYIPSLGAGYCQGPYGPTQTYSTNVPTGSQPVKIADWGITQPGQGTGVSFQPVAFMSLLASASEGGRPVIEVRIGTGANANNYNAQTLVARGVGRNCWNDLQAITVLPIPGSAGHTGIAGTGYSPTYNAWLSAWVYDANNVSVGVQNSDILSAGVFLMRYQP